MRFFTFTLLGLLWAASLSALTEAGQPARSDAQRMFRQLDQNHDGQLASEEIASDQARLFTRLLRTADRDGDGRLSAEEFEAGLQAKRTARPLAEKQQVRLPGADALLLLVAMMDANADGVIQFDEVPERLLPCYLRLEQRVGRSEPRQIKVGARELAQAAPGLTQFALVTVNRLELDVDLEIALLPDENWALIERLDRPRQPGEVLANAEQALELFHTLDTNGDGQIVFEEIPEPYAARFDRLLARADRNRDQRLSEREMRALSRRLRAATASQPTPKQADLDQNPMVPQESPMTDE